jgi:hypothetical protein
MPEEMESPVETLGESAHEAAVEAQVRWLKWCAGLSAMFAVLAAIAGLSSAHYINNSMIEQIKASDQWGYYQAKSIKGMLVEMEQTLETDRGQGTGDAAQRLIRYQSEQKESQTEAERLTAASEQHLHQHEILSRAVTLFQIAIAMVAIAVLTRRKSFVLVSAGLAAFGGWFLVAGFLG